MYKKLLLASIVVSLMGCGESSDTTENTSDVVNNSGNTAAIITGATSGLLYYKDDAIQASLSIVDPDDGEAFFNEQNVVSTTYGFFSITSSGDWTYEVPISSEHDLGDLDSGQTVSDSVTVSSIDGTEQVISFSIASADDAPDDDGDDNDDNDSDDGDDIDPVFACEEPTSVDSSDSNPVLSGNTYEVDADDLSSTLSSVTGGDIIVITGGDSISLKDVCFDSPVLIKAATVGGVTLETASINRSQNIILQGFVFGPNDNSTLVKIADSKNIKVLRNKFDHKDVTIGQNSLVMTGASEEITVAYNEFLDKNMITEIAEVEGDVTSYRIGNSGSYIKFQFDDETVTMTKEAHIHHNYFKNIEAYVKTGETKPEGDSDREAIVFGDSGSQDIVTNHLIEYNLFEDADGENEIMTVKTSGNTFSHNTFLNSMGSLSFRLGHDNTAEYNYFYGTDADASDPVEYFDGSTVEKVANYQTGGVRIYGENHIVRGNYMENLSGDTWRLPILVDSGDDSDSSGGNNHETPTNVLIEDNILVNNLNGGIQVGGNKYPNMPSSNTFNNNKVIGSTGNLYFSYAAGTANTWTGNTVYATDSTAIELSGENAGAGITLTDAQLLIVDEMSATTLTPLTPSDVGPEADVASSSD